MALTPKQERFIEEYLIDMNATQAAIRARYSVANADKIGPELLGKTRIREAIDKAMAKRSRRTGISQDRVINEIAKVAFANMKDFAKWDDRGVEFKASESLSDADSSCIAEVSETEIETDYGVKRTKKIKLHDKLAALEKLGKHLGMFKDNINLNANIVQIVDDVGSGQDDTG